MASLMASPAIGLSGRLAVCVSAQAGSCLRYAHRRLVFKPAWIALTRPSSFSCGACHSSVFHTSSLDRPSPELANFFISVCGVLVTPWVG